MRLIDLLRRIEEDTYITVIIGNEFCFSGIKSSLYDIELYRKKRDIYEDADVYSIGLRNRMAYIPDGTPNLSIFIDAEVLRHSSSEFE